LARYTQLLDKDIEEIAGLYGLVVSSFDSIAGGAENSSYLLGTDQGRIVLTLFESKTMEEAQRLGKLLRYLEHEEFPSTRLISLPDESLVGSYQEFPVMLKHYLDGQVHKELIEDKCRQLGGTLARLHALPAPDFLADEPAFGLRRIRRGLAEVRDEGFRKWLSERAAWVEQELAGDLPSGIVHADLFSDNLLFDGEHLVALIDFEDAGHFKLVYDIGMAIVGTCLIGTKIAWPKAAALVESYEEVRELKSSEREAIKASIVYGALSTAYWRYWKYNIRQPTPLRADKHLEMKAVAENGAALSADEVSAHLFS